MEPHLHNIARGRADLALAEVDIVASSGTGVVAVGSVKWRERGPLGAADLADLARARALVPGAETAALVAVCPAGSARRVPTDLTLDAAGILAAWKA